MVKNLLLSLASLLVTFVLCEAGARMFLPAPRDIEVTVAPKTASTTEKRAASDDTGSISPVLDWSGPHGIRLYPNITATIHKHTLSRQDVELQINSLGLRSPEIPNEKGAGFRILAIGDSITLGDYLPQAQTIPDLLQQKLSGHNKNALVLNAGLPGASTSDEFYHYQELSDSVQPDLVLVGMYLNDAQNSDQFYAKKLSFPFSQSRILAFIFERLHFLNIQQSVQNVGIDPLWKETFRAGRNLTSGDMLGSREGFDFEIFNASQDFGLAWNPAAWKNLSSMVEVFARATKERGQTLLVYLLPVHMQVYGNAEIVSTYPQEQFMQMCRKLGLHCLDLLPTLRDAAQSLPMREMFYDHCHYRAAGNEIVASTLTPWVKKYVPQS